MLIERMIFLYNPFDRAKDLLKQKEIDDIQKEKNLEPLLDIKELISIEELKNEEEEQKKTEKEIIESSHLIQNKLRESHSLAIKSQKENISQYPIFYKFIFQIFLLICVGYFVFIFMPTNGTNSFPIKHDVDGTVYFIKGNGYLMGFYFLYCLYFLLSSFQIK